MEDDILKYTVEFPRGTKTKDIPALLKRFFSTQVVPTVDNLVVRHHDYTVKPKGENVAVVGAMHIIPVVRANPSVQEFDLDYSEMEMTNPETYFRKHQCGALNSPQFRAKMFTFVSLMGENYGYGVGNHVYHRRASLIMPKIKITKAVPEAQMMYHTHPRKDEPSLSSPDDFLLYMDLSHKPRKIRHFYTVMADRMDYFQISPKKDSKENFVKLDEDKLLKEISAEMDEVEAQWDEKMPKSGDHQEDLRYCENITRDMVKWMNKKYSKYFTITYKCHYKVKKNPPEPEIADLHLNDEILGKSLDAIKNRDYSWDAPVKEKAHERYTYWHQIRREDTLQGSATTLGITPQGSHKRTYERYMKKVFEDSPYTYFDVLNILTLSHDIAMIDSKIRDGGELSSRMEEMCEYLGMPEEATETLLFLEEVIHNEDIFTEEAQTMSGDFYGLALIAAYTIQAIQSIDLVKQGKKEFNIIEYEIYTVLKSETQERFQTFLVGELDARGKAYGENAPIAQGFVDSFLNPPQVSLKKVELEHVFPKEAFAYDTDLVKEALDEFNVEKYDPKKNFYNLGRIWLRFPTTVGQVSMGIARSTGKAQIFVTGRPDYMEDALDAVTKVGTALIRYGLPGIDPETYDVQAIDIAQNPQSSQVIAIAGPSGAGKSTTIRSLLKLLPNSKTAPTLTTRQKRKSDKPGERIFVSVEQFKKEMNEGNLVAAGMQKNGNYYGRRKSDFESAGYVIIDVNPNGVNAIKRAYPNAFTVYLEPVEDPEFIRKRLLRRGDMSPQEAKARTSIIPAHIKGSKNIDFDVRVKTKQGEFAKIALELEPMIPKQNPNMRELVGQIVKGRFSKRIYTPLKVWNAERKMSDNDRGEAKNERMAFQRHLRGMKLLDELSPEERLKYDHPTATEFFQVGDSGRSAAQYDKSLTPEEKEALRYTIRGASLGGGSYSGPSNSLPIDFATMQQKPNLLAPIIQYGVQVGGASYEHLIFSLYKSMNKGGWRIQNIKKIGNITPRDSSSAMILIVELMNLMDKLSEESTDNIPNILDYRNAHPANKDWAGRKLWEGHEPWMPKELEEHSVSPEDQLLFDIMDAFSLVQMVTTIDHEMTHKDDESSYTMGIDFSSYDEEGNIMEEYDPEDLDEKYKEDEWFTDMTESTPQMIESVNEYAGLAISYLSKNKYLVAQYSQRKQRAAEVPQSEREEWTKSKHGPYWGLNASVDFYVVEAPSAFLAGAKVKISFEEDLESNDFVAGAIYVNPTKKPKAVRIEESPNKEKKLVAYFYDKDGKKFRTVHFGARGMSDFTQHKDPDRMKNYLARHGGMGEDWKDPMTAGALSRWILWGKPSLRESFNDFKKRFKLEGVMAVTNTKMNPHHCPIEVEARRAASDPSFKHHEWYIEHHLDYVMAIMKRMPKVMGNWDQEMIDMVWMHDYPKMMGKGDDLSVVLSLLEEHRGEDYAHKVVHQLHLMERVKKPDWNSLTEYSMVAANLSTADALAHYYGPFWQIYMDENPDVPLEELKKRNAAKLEKDKRKLRAGPMKDGLDGVKFQYKGRKVRVVGNEHIAELITRKNPKAPGYNSYGWTTQDWRSIKVNNKGDIDYSEKCGAEDTQVADGSPRLCLPAEVIRSLLRTESGKDVIRTQARKKARAKKGVRVPWHPRIKKIWKRVEDQTPKDNPALTYDLMSVVTESHLERVNEILFPEKTKRWKNSSDARKKSLIRRAKQFRADMKYGYGWTGRTAKTAIEAMLTDYSNTFNKNGYAKVYRGLITLPSENLSAVFDKYGTGRHWSSYKEGADDYVSTPIHDIPGAVLVLVEGKVHINEVAPPEQQLRARINFPLEKEIIVNKKVEVIRYSIWSIDPTDRVKEPKWTTTGKDWKPWLRRGVKPLKVVEVNETFSAETPQSQDTWNNPNQDYYAIVDGKPVYLVKDNAPSFITARDPQKWADRYDKIIKMSGDQLMELAEKQAAEKGLRLELVVKNREYKENSRQLKLPPKQQKMYKEYIESIERATITLSRGNKLIDALHFTILTQSPTELIEYLTNRKVWRKESNGKGLDQIGSVRTRYDGNQLQRSFWLNEIPMVASLQNKKRFPFAVAGGGGYEMSEGQKGKGYYGIIKTYQAGFLEANNMEQYGMGVSPMRSDLYQSYGWLTAFSYKDNYPYPSRAAEYYLNLHGKDKSANKGADYENLYRPVYSSRSNPHHEDTHPLFPADLPPDFEPDFPDAEEDSEDNPSDSFGSYNNEFDAIEAAQKLANETGRTQNVMAVLHMEEDGYSEVEYQITEETVWDGPSNWLVKTLEPKKTRDNPSEWRHGEFAEEDPFKDYFSEDE